jgi:AraC family transcriptional regulator
MALVAEERFVSPMVAAYDVACSARRHERSDEEAVQTAQLVVPRRGAFAWNVGTRTMLAEPNTVLLFHPAYAHRVTHPIDGGDDCTSIHLAPELSVDALGRAASAPRYWILDGPSQRTIHLAMHAMRDHPDALAREEAAMTVLRLVADAPEPRTERHAPAVDALRERLAADPSERSSLHELSRGTGLSPYELARQFRARTGSSIHQYRLRLRLLLALARVRDGACDITALAYDLGFSSHAHFTSAFRSAFGKSPREMRSLGRPSTSAG